MVALQCGHEYCPTCATAYYTNTMMQESEKKILSQMACDRLEQRFAERDRAMNESFGGGIRSAHQFCDDLRQQMMDQHRVIQQLQHSYDSLRQMFHTRDTEMFEWQQRAVDEAVQKAVQGLERTPAHTDAHANAGSDGSSAPPGTPSPPEETEYDSETSEEAAPLPSAPLPPAPRLVPAPPVSQTEVSADAKPEVAIRFAAPETSQVPPSSWVQKASMPSSRLIPEELTPTSRSSNNSASKKATPAPASIPPIESFSPKRSPNNNVSKQPTPAPAAKQVVASIDKGSLESAKEKLAIGQAMIVFNCAEKKPPSEFMVSEDNRPVEVLAVYPNDDGGKTYCVRLAWQKVVGDFRCYNGSRFTAPRNAEEYWLRTTDSTWKHLTRAVIDRGEDTSDLDDCDTITAHLEVNLQAGGLVAVHLRPGKTRQITQSLLLDRRGKKSVGWGFKMMKDDVTVASVAPTSPAYTAGLRPGMVVVTDEGSSMQQLRRMTIKIMRSQCANPTKVHGTVTHWDGTKGRIKMRDTSIDGIPVKEPTGECCAIALSKFVKPGETIDRGTPVEFFVQWNLTGNNSLFAYEIAKAKPL
eukprot:TRINITY_DN1389_c0_g3_i1.p1 TRINITY_DN1389_c0_g3~~TRINITY_DN1389_c0_g3_i1.p1  ORF type:complete len:603 (+),score=101.73 TRINITY_DN1389_c0_g3_i1:66-1811(+)